jgi:hypothetical protein
MTEDYIDMFNNESPLKKKNLWHRIKVGVFTVIGFSFAFGSYLTYDKTEYANKSKSIREAYLTENYVFAEELCTEQSKNKILFGLISESDNSEMLKTVTEKIHELQLTSLLDEERRKIKKDIEMILFQSSDESILRLSRYVGSYSKSIDSLSKTNAAYDALVKIDLADYESETYLNKENIAFLVKIILENENYTKENNMLDSVATIVNNFDYGSYYEKKAEKMLYQTMYDTTDLSLWVQNLYLEAINATTDKIMANNGTKLHDDYMKVKIQELTSKLNLVNEYIQVLRYVENK